MFIFSHCSLNKNQPTPANMTTLTIICIVAIIVLVFMYVEKKFEIADNLSETLSYWSMDLKEWFKERVALLPCQHPVPVDMVVLSSKYFEDVAAVASMWVAIPYSKDDYMAPARSFRNRFKTENGFIVTGFRKVWPITPLPEISIAWLYGPIESVFITERDWNLIKDGNWDGYVLRCHEERFVHTGRFGKMRTLTSGKLVGPVSQVEIAKLKAVDAFIAS